MLAVALAAALSSLWYHYRTGHRSVEFWGSDTAVLIAKAPQAEALRLAAADSNGADNGSRPLAALGLTVVEQSPLGQARGFSNIRRALVQDATFDWQARRPMTAPAWRYALRLVDGSRTAIVLFDFESSQIALATAPAAASLDRDAALGLQTFLEEQFPNSSRPPDAGP
jgi:hypothetical protein